MIFCQLTRVCNNRFTKRFAGVSYLPSMGARKSLFCHLIVFALSLNSSAHATDEGLSRIEGGARDAGAFTFENVIGSISDVSVRFDDTLHVIASRTGSGLAELILANPGVDPWLPEPGTSVRIPSRYVLPQALRADPSSVDPSKIDSSLSGDGGRTSVVVNLPELRLYLKQGHQVKTYPVSIGKSNFPTPVMDTTVTAKAKDPHWQPPASLINAALERGEKLAPLYLPGPDNPLGRHALRLGNTPYLIHGTNRPLGLGLRVSHGCIRMYPLDVEEVFSRLDLGAQVQIVNEPIKVSWSDGELLMEVHPPLQESGMDEASLMSLAMDLAFAALLNKPGSVSSYLASTSANNSAINSADTISLGLAWLDDAAVAKAVAEKNGLPVVIASEAL